MINLDDYFSDFSPEEYIEQTDEYFNEIISRILPLLKW